MFTHLKKNTQLAFCAVIVTLLQACNHSVSLHEYGDLDASFDKNCKLDTWFLTKADIGSQAFDELCDVEVVMRGVYPWEPRSRNYAVENSTPLLCQCGANAVYARSLSVAHTTLVGIRLQGASRSEHKAKPMTHQVFMDHIHDLDSLDLGTPRPHRTSTPR